MVGMQRVDNLRRWSARGDHSRLAAAGLVAQGASLVAIGVLGLVAIEAYYRLDQERAVSVLLFALTAPFTPAAGIIGLLLACAVWLHWPIRLAVLACEVVVVTISGILLVGSILGHAFAAAFALGGVVLLGAAVSGLLLSKAQRQ